MNTIPVSLEQHVFPHIFITANPTFNQTGQHPVEGNVESELKVIAVPDNDRRFMTELHVRLDAETNQHLPYSIDVICLCFLTVGEPIADNDRKGFAASVGHGIMFPAIRELVISLTARQPWGAFSIGLGTLEQQGDIATESEPASVVKKAPRKLRTKAKS